MESAPTCYRHPEVPTRIFCQRCSRPICPQCMVPASVGFQCRSCVTQGMRETRQRDLPYGGKRSANPAITSIVLIAMSAAVFVAVSVAGGAGSGLFRWLSLKPLGQCLVGDGRMWLTSKPECLSAGLQWVDGVSTGAWWQIVTSAFTHADVMHIAFNMLALWFLGPQLERVYGWARFLGVYVVSALMASAFVMLLSNPWSATVGASGAVFGLMGAILLVAYKHKGNVRTILIWLGANVVITVVGSSFISWQGHLGGFVGGVLAAAAIMYLPKKLRGPGQWVALAAVGAVAIALIVARALTLA